MRKLNILLVMMTNLCMTACINDLNVTPIDPNLTTANVVYTDVNSYKMGLAKLYAAFAVSGQQGPSGQPDISGINEDFGSYLRAYWNCQELSTDEAVIAWNDQTIKDFHWQTWSASDVFITAMYSRIIYTATLCNEYIRTTEGNTDPDIQRFHAEARFLRALAYYHGLDLFGNIPFVTEKDKVGAFLPKQISRADLYAYIESELNDIESKLGEPKFEYARADKAVLWMLQAKLYLNAHVFIGEDKYTECLTALNKLLDGPYSIAPTYANNFVADNDGSTEMIFPVTFHGEFTKCDGGTTYLIHAAIGGTMSPSSFGVGGGWGGLRTTSALVNKFSDGDARAMFWTDQQKLEIDDISQFGDGYAVTKYSNLTSVGQLPVPNADPTYAYTDYPMFRLADAYLMYAEAILRGGQGGDIGQALDYVNALRQRAYGDASGNITSGALTLDFILDERARELFWEGHRRTDLIRYGRFTGGDYLWPWKGNVKDGAATHAYRNLFPIPSNDIGANPNLTQNDGY
jgi:starch-binding outer membrane protein, SusD/RagB family